MVIIAVAIINFSLGGMWATGYTTVEGSYYSKKAVNFRQIATSQGRP